ncbi:15-hydroxyprostaglandin dehydrogenase [NAD(+)]-like [Glandiceps talaboti]
MNLNGKVALITGGADGIGKGLAEQFLHHEAKGVFLIDINKVKGQETLKTLREQYGDDRVQFCACDITSKEELQGSFKRCMEQYGHLDIVCNNAGILDEEKRELTLAVNLLAVIEGTYLAVEYMGTKNGGKGGVVINTSSANGLVPFKYLPVYTASKYGVVGFTRSVAFQPSVLNNGVRVLAICPRLIETTMVRDKFWGDGSEYSEELKTFKPNLKIDDVTSVVLELICDTSVNGTVNLINADKQYVAVPPQTLD